MENENNEILDNEISDTERIVNKETIPKAKNSPYENPKVKYEREKSTPVNSSIHVDKLSIFLPQYLHLPLKNI